MPKAKSNVDYTECTDEDVVRTLALLKDHQFKYRIFY